MPVAPLQDSHSGYVRFRLDPHALDDHVEPTLLLPLKGEMPKVDDRYVTKPYNTVFLCIHTNADGSPSQGGMWNTIAICDVKTGKHRYWSAGDSTVLEEVAFCPRTKDCTSRNKFHILEIAFLLADISVFCSTRSRWLYHHHG